MNTKTIKSKLRKIGNLSTGDMMKLLTMENEADRFREAIIAGHCMAIAAIVERLIYFIDETEDQKQCSTPTPTSTQHSPVIKHH